jgi:MSHA biogenesis protein MshO
VVNNTVTLNDNPFANQDVPGLTSPGRRFHVVTSAVTYECNPNAGTVTRYWDYGIVPTQPSDSAITPLAGKPRALLATRISACSFSYDDAAFSAPKTGLVGLTFTMSAAGAEAVELRHQVYVDNTP